MFKSLSSNRRAPMLRGSLPQRALNASLALAITMTILGCNKAPPSDPAMASASPASAPPASAELFVHVTADDPQMKASAVASALAPAEAASAKAPSAGKAQLGGASVSGGHVSNASAVVAGMASGFRRCYNRGLAENPEMEGSIKISAQIGPNGEVLSSSPSGGGGLSAAVVSCVKARVASAQFAPPEGGSATIVIPVTLVRK